MISKLTKIMTNPKLIQFVLIVFFVVIFLRILLNSGSRLQSFYKKNIAPPKGDNINEFISDIRRAELESLADKLHDNIYNYQWTLDDFINNLSMFLGLRDSEFVYLTNYYNKAYQGEGLYYDIDWEFLPFTDIDDKVLTRMEAMNLTKKRLI